MAGLGWFHHLTTDNAYCSLEKNERPEGKDGCHSGYINLHPITSQPLKSTWFASTALCISEWLFGRVSSASPSSVAILFSDRDTWLTFFLSANAPTFFLEDLNSQIDNQALWFSHPLIALPRCLLPSLLVDWLRLPWALCQPSLHQELLLQCLSCGIPSFWSSYSLSASPVVLPQAQPLMPSMTCNPCTMWPSTCAVCPSLSYWLCQRQLQPRPSLPLLTSWAAPWNSTLYLLDPFANLWIPWHLGPATVQCSIYLMSLMEIVKNLYDLARFLLVCPALTQLWCLWKPHVPLKSSKWAITYPLGKISQDPADTWG